jgi:hypothetical protein
VNIGYFIANLAFTDLVQGIKLEFPKTDLLKSFLVSFSPKLSLVKSVYETSEGFTEQASVFEGLCNFFGVFCCATPLNKPLFVRVLSRK